METTYELATTPQDFRKCHKLLNDGGVTFTKLQSPTIMALRGKDIIGVVSTFPYKDYIIVEPLYVDMEAVNGNPAFVVKNLITAYETVLMLAGVHSYRFSVLKENEGWMNVVLKSETAKPIYTDPETGEVWFERELGNARIHTDSI